MTQPVAALVDATGHGDRAALARLLTIVESGGDAARDALAALPADAAGNAAVVGITGAPGAGKSTLTDGLVARLRRAGERVAVLAIDPTSPFTGGAILGDRVRMQDHDTDDGVFVRSMATRGELGGLSRAAPHAVRVLDAAGLRVDPRGDRRRRSGGGRDRRYRRHDDRRRHARLGRRDPGEQGRPARDRRRVRRQQGRPRRCRTRPSATSRGCSCSGSTATGRRRSFRRSRPTAAASTSSSTRSPRTAGISSVVRGARGSGANCAFGTSCARSCSSGLPSRPMPSVADRASIAWLLESPTEVSIHTLLPRNWSADQDQREG